MRAALSAGNPLSIAATRATPEHVLTDPVFAGMTNVATYFATGVQSLIDRHGAATEELVGA